MEPSPMEPSRGLKTTEFWMFALTGVALILNGTPMIEVPQEQMMAWFAMTGLYGGLRTAEKTLVKRPAARAILEP